MITNTRDQIIEYVAKHGQARPNDLVKLLGFTNTAIHRQLRKLVLESILQKVGKPPIVFYTLSEKQGLQNQNQIFPKTKEKAINTNFLSITPTGDLLFGVEGFMYWVKTYQKNKSLDLLSGKYLEEIEKREKYKTKEGLIDASVKLRDFSKAYVDKLFYQDIYSLPLFGRTKLAKLVMYAKQIEDKNLTDKVALEGKPLIEKIIKRFKINAVCFIPPTIPRKFQFMDELEQRLNLNLPKIDLVKVSAGDIPIPQKTLSTLSERVVNAKSSIYLKNTQGRLYANILLIDDVAGSGASFNETGKKLKNLRIGYKKIYAFAFVGNIKGYEVIRQI